MKLDFHDAAIAAAFNELCQQNQDLAERCAAWAFRYARAQDEIAGYKTRLDELAKGISSGGG